MYSTSTVSKMIVEDHTGINSENEGNRLAANQYSAVFQSGLGTASPILLMQQHVKEFPSGPCPSHRICLTTCIFILPVHESNCSWICLVASSNHLYLFVSNCVNFDIS